MYSEFCVVFLFCFSFYHDFALHQGNVFRRGRDRMVVGFTTTCAISSYITLTPGTPDSSTNKTDRLDITEINIVESGVKHHKLTNH